MGSWPAISSEYAQLLSTTSRRWGGARRPCVHQSFAVALPCVLRGPAEGERVNRVLERRGGVADLAEQDAQRTFRVGLQRPVAVEDRPVPHAQRDRRSGSRTLLKDDRVEPEQRHAFTPLRARGGRGQGVQDATHDLRGVPRPAPRGFDVVEQAVDPGLSHLPPQRPQVASGNRSVSHRPPTGVT